MSQIVPYLFESKEVRVVLDEHGEPWFVSADVCACLDITTEQVRRLDDDEKGLRSVQTPGGSQQMSVVNEPGLYTLVLGSRKPEAKRFKRWVTHEVLPSIRKTGRYDATAHTNPPEVNAILAMSKSEIFRLAADLQEKVEKQEALIAAQAPKVAAHTRFMDASGTMNLRDTAKVLGEPEKAFIALLVEDKVLYRMQGNGRLRAYAHLEERGYFKHRAGSSEQTGKAYAQVRVTPAGLDWLSQRYPPKALAVQADLF